MDHYAYITTNLVNGKQYVGDHSTDNLDDGYLGSGKIISAAIKKYGKNNFSKEILEHFENKKDAFSAQEKYIQQYNTMDPHGYNVSPTGGLCVKGCLKHTKESKEKISKNNCRSQYWRGKKLSEEHKQNISKANKNCIPWNKGIPHSENTKQKIAQSEKGKIISKETRIKMSNAAKGKPKSEEHRKKCGIANLGKKSPKIYCKYCKKEYADYMFKLYHGDKCKKKDI